MTAYEDHGEHWCGSQIVYDPVNDIHMCTGMHDDPDLVIEPGDCEPCNDRDRHELKRDRLITVQPSAKQHPQ